MFDFQAPKFSRSFWAGLGCGACLILPLLLVLITSGYRIAHKDRLVTPTPDNSVGFNHIGKFATPDSEDSEEPVVDPLLNPKALWDSILGDPQNHEVHQLSRIAETRWETEGLQILDEIYAAPLNRIDGDAVANTILSRAIDEDYATALRQALELEHANRFWVILRIAESWGHDDPLAALAAIAKAGISSSFDRGRFEKAVIESWAQRDPEALMGKLDLLPSGHRLLGEQSALEAIAQSSPRIAAEHLHTISNPVRTLALAKVVARSWVASNPDEALDWVNSVPLASLGIKREVQTVVLDELAKQDPSYALTLALDEPVDRRLGGLEFHVIKRVATTDVDLALQMLPEVRVHGSGYLDAYASVGQTLIQHRDYVRALELASQIDKWNQTSYYQRITHQWAKEDPVSLLEQMESFPSPEIRSLAGANLLRVNRVSLALNRDQMNLAWGYLTADTQEAMREYWFTPASTMQVKMEYRPNQLRLSEEEWDEFQRDMKNFMIVALRNARK